ncbi:MAG: hypothetical protein WAN36_05895 [Calditrichia bacterium]
MRRFFARYSLILFLMIMAGCSIDKPVMPKWEVPLVLPFSPEKIVFGEELVNDSTIVSIGDSLFIHLNGQINSDSLNLTIPAQDTLVRFTVDTLQADTLDGLNTGFIGISDLLPELEQNIGQPFYLPQMNFGISSRQVPGSEFKRVKIEEGKIRVTLYNNLPITIGPNAQSPQGIKIKVLDDSTGTQISEVLISDPIPPGSSGSGTAPLTATDQWVNTPLRLSYNIAVASDTMFTVTQDLLDNAGYEIDLKFFDLKVLEIVGKVPAQTLTRRRQMRLQYRDQLVSASIAKGQIGFEITNPLPIEAYVQVTLPELFSPLQRSFTHPFVVPPNSSITDLINLKDFELKNSQNPGSVLKDLHFIITAATQASQNFVHMRISDEVEIDFSMAPVRLKSFEGILAADTLFLPSILESNIASYEELEDSGIHFSGAEFTLGFNNQAAIENMNLNYKLTGYHRDKYGVLSDSANIEFIDEPIDLSGIERILLSGSQVDDFLNIFPTDISGQGIISYGGYATIADCAAFQGDYSFTTPFRIRIKDAVPIEINPDTLRKKDIDNDLRHSAGDEIRSARFSGTIKNLSPLGGRVEMIVSADPLHTDIYDSSYFNPDLEFIKSIRFQKAVKDPISGLISEPAESSLDFELSQEELTLFQTPPLRVGFLVKLSDTNGYVLLRGSNYLEISGQFEIQFLVKE